MDMLLSVPFTQKRKTQPLELLRQLLITYAHDIEADSRKRIVGRVLESELRSLFPAEKRARPPQDGANTGHLAVILDRLAPKPGQLEKSGLACGVTVEEQELVRRYMEHPLPHKRVIGYCAFLCLCAHRRGEVS